MQLSAGFVINRAAWRGTAGAADVVEKWPGMALGGRRETGCGEGCAGGSPSHTQPSRHSASHPSYYQRFLGPYGIFAISVSLLVQLSPCSSPFISWHEQASSSHCRLHTQHTPWHHGGGHVRFNLRRVGEGGETAVQPLWPPPHIASWHNKRTRAREWAKVR